MTRTSELPDLIEELLRAKREFSRLRSDEEDQVGPRPPASQGQIAALERELGAGLPPSYRAFLELHNGWPDFSGAAKLLAVEDHASEWVRERIAYWSDLMEDGQNPFKRGAIPVLLGETENHFLVLDPTTVRKNGEMDFVDYDYGQEFQRFADFTSFLENDLKVMTRLIDREINGVGEADDDRTSEG